MREVILQSFKQRWEHVHAMTRTFAECVPDAHWQSAPQAGFAPFCKQLRHMVCVRGVYNEALHTKRINFGRKHAYYSGGLERAELLAALDQKHSELLSLLSAIPDDLDRPQIDFFGHQRSY